jgi:biopolymer transport protein ExbB
MKFLGNALLVLGLANAAFAQEGQADGATLNRLSQTAEEELKQSNEELNQLRAAIAAEKLPMSQELTQLEQRLVELRAEHDRVTREEAEGNLALTNTKAEHTARRDELLYMANLLDEYARNLESKVSVGELQQFGAGIEAAKAVAENTSLSMTEKFTRQVACVDLSVQRLFDVIGGMRFPGIAVDLQGTVVNGKYAILGPVALFRADNGSTAGLAVPQTGSDKPLVRPLEGSIQAGIAALVESGEGLIPLDPSRGGALKELVQETNLWEVFEQGGPIMWPLLLASILALGTVIERVFFLTSEKLRRDPVTLDRFFTAVGRGNTEEAIQISKGSKFYVVRALGYALAHRETSLASALLYSQAQELKRFTRGVSILDTVITLAPLLGLLGTVTGMMGSFSLIGGDLSAPGAITGGIAEALIATAFGLGIAITSLLPFNYLNTRIEQVRQEIESAATQLELLVGPRDGQSGPGAGHGPAEHGVPVDGGSPVHWVPRPAQAPAFALGKD